MDFSAVIAEELKLEVWRVAKALELMDQGGTVPFIARYRKDQTGTLNEIELRDISHRRDYLQELTDRKETVIKSIEEQGKMTPELKAQIEACKDKTLLEDIYAPYKPKKRTRATIAKELGLEPLARLMWAQENTGNTAEETPVSTSPRRRALPTRRPPSRALPTFWPKRLPTIPNSASTSVPRWKRPA